jgi:hypothetical protein
MTLSNLSYMWYFFIFTKAMNNVMPSSCTKAYVEIMGIGNYIKEHTYNNLGSKES